MSQGSHIFAQAVALLDWAKFESIVKAHMGDKFVKTHNCRDLLTTMLFAHFAGADSLREIAQGMQSHGGALAHLGILKPFRKSSLAESLAKRPWQVYRDMFEHMAATLGKGMTGGPKPGRIKAKLFSVDSTTIDLCLSMFEWARFRKAKGAVKIHTVLDHDSLLPVFAHVGEGRAHDVKAFKRDVLPAIDFPRGSVVAMDRGYVDYGLFADLNAKGIFFVTRRKDNAVLETLETLSEVPFVLTDGGIVVKDEIVTPASGQHRELRLRLIHFVDPAKRKIVLCTNHLKWAASTITDIYKQRWQVELFFKQLKQNLKIDSFLATSENAVKVQVYSSLCAIVLMRHLKQKSDNDRSRCKLRTYSFSNLTTMLRINLLQFHALKEWLRNPFLPPPALGHMDLCKQIQIDFTGQQTEMVGGALGETPKTRPYALISASQV